jgi:hypothetical protein
MPVYRGTWVITDSVLGGSGTNTWHARTTGGLDPTGVSGVLNGLNAALGDFYVACESIYHGGCNLHFDGSWVRVDDDSKEIVRGNTNDVAITGTTDALPPSQCLVVGWGTSIASKSARGRTFMGPLRTSVLQDNGTPTEAARTLVEAAAADLIDSFDGIGSGALAVWSVLENVARDFTDGRVANRFSVLRSRRD